MKHILSLLAAILLLLWIAPRITRKEYCIRRGRIAFIDTKDGQHEQNRTGGRGWFYAGH